MATIGATVHTTPLGIGRYHVNQVDSLLTSRKPPSLRPNQEPFGFLAGPINVSRITNDGKPLLPSPYLIAYYRGRG